MRRLLCLALCLLLLLAACAAEPVSEDGLRVWYPTARGASALGWEVLPADAPSPTIAQLAARLFEDPDSPDLSSPFPATVTLHSVSVTDGVLTVDLSGAYAELPVAVRTVADACLALTLCQMEGVDAVRTTAGGDVLPGGSLALRPGDFLLSGAGGEPVYITATLYFPRLEGRGLGVEQRAVLVPEGETVSAAIAAALLAGPERDALRSLIPAGTAIIDASASDRVCTVNFSAAFRTGLDALSESDAHLLIYSIVDTLGNLDNVSSVRILVAGEALPDLPGIPVSRPLEPDFRLTED